MPWPGTSAPSSESPVVKGYRCPAVWRRGCAALCAVVVAAHPSAASEGAAGSTSAETPGGVHAVVDDAPAAAQLLQQAGQVAATDPARAAELLAQVLDEYGTRLVPVPGQAHLHRSAGRLAEELLLADESVRAQFRARQRDSAQRMVEKGALQQVLASRMVTAAGLDAALRLAEVALDEGRCLDAEGALARVAAHDLLTGDAARRHQALCARAAAYRDAQDAPEAFDPADAQVLWSAILEGVAITPPEQGFVPIQLPAPMHPLHPVPQAPPGPALQDAPGEGDLRFSTGPLTRPAADARCVYVNEGTGLTARDRLTGARMWTTVPDDAVAFNEPAVLRGAAVTGDAVVGLVTRSGGSNPTGGTSLQCCDATTGALRWERALDPAGAQGSTGSGTEKYIAAGVPMAVGDGVVVPVRRVGGQLETESIIYSIHPDHPVHPTWSTILASLPAAARHGVRAAEAPVLGEGALYVATGTGVVGRIDPGSGQVVWVRTFPVPERLERAPIWEFTAPAVAGGLLCALPPGGETMVILDAETGTMVRQVSLAPGSALGGARTVIALPQRSLVAAIGEEVVVFDPANPELPRWRWRATDAEGRNLPVSGCATWGVVEGVGSALLVPAGGGIHVLDADAGKEVGRIETAGNLVLTQGQLLCAGSALLAAWMDPALALARAQAWLAQEDAPEAWLRLLQCAITARAADVALEAAEAAATRWTLGTDESQTLLRLLLQLDRKRILNAAQEARLESLLEKVATAAGAPERARLAAAERRMRAAAAAEEKAQAARHRLEAARILCALLLEEREGDEQVRLQDGPVTMAFELPVLALLAQAAKEPGAARGAVEVIQAALPEAMVQGAGKTSTEGSSLARLRTAVRMARAVRDQELRERLLTALAHRDPSAAARLRAEGTEPPALPEPHLRVSETGEEANVVKIDAPLCATTRGPQPWQDQVLTGGTGRVVMRRAPSFAPAWEAETGSGASTIVAGSAKENLVLWTQRAQGKGNAVCVDPQTGQARWQTATAVELLGALADLPEQDMRVTLLDGTQARLDDVLPMECDGILLLLRRDGAAVALKQVDAGMQVLWRRRAEEEEAGGVVVEAVAGRGWVALAMVERRDGYSVHPSIQVLDARSGESVLSWSFEEGLAPELQWLRLLPGGVLAAGTDTGIQAWRPAGGDEQEPCWRLDSPDVQYTLDGWPAGKWLLVQTIRDEIVAIDAATGRTHPEAFQSPDPSYDQVITVVASGKWVALVRQRSVECFTPEGTFLGSMSVEDGCELTAAAAGGEYLVLTCVREEYGADPHLPSWTAQCICVAPAHDARQVGAPVVIRGTGAAISEIQVVEGWILISGGDTVHAVDFRGVGLKPR